jgi:hypothetical protein
VNLQGKIELSSCNELTGSLDYGVPAVLTRVEYPDGQPDPIFQQGGEWSWLRTQVKGLGNMPGDDMAEIEARAQSARASRPARIPFDQIDINRLSDQLDSKPTQMMPEQTPQQNDSGLNSLSEDPFNPFAEKEEDPFSTSAPF